MHVYPNFIYIKKPSKMKDLNMDTQNIDLKKKYWQTIDETKITMDYLIINIYISFLFLWVMHMTQRNSEYLLLDNHKWIKRNESRQWNLIYSCAVNKQRMYDFVYTDVYEDKEKNSSWWIAHKVDSPKVNCEAWYRLCELSLYSDQWSLIHVA